MRAICTSASLQASTWVSPGFTLFRHSSPPFGSKQAHSNSTSVEAGRCWAFVLCAHHWSCDLPFSTRDGTCIILSLARLFDSLVRVSRRVEAPHSLRQALSITEMSSLTRRMTTHYFRSLYRNPCSALITLQVSRSPARRMLRWSALTDVMEVRPLSLSRLQVLCHSLSKVLFKLSLTLLVRYRSSYSVFNFGRHIPAASHCIPKQCYSLDAVS